MKTHDESVLTYNIKIPYYYLYIINRYYIYKKRLYLPKSISHSMGQNILIVLSFPYDHL